MSFPAKAALALLLLLPAGARGEWVHARGSTIFPPEISESEACQQAEDRATAEAIRRLTGESFESDEAVLCTETAEEADCNRHALIWTLLGGEIHATRDKTLEVQTVQDVFHQCVVTFDADIQFNAGKPDPNFTLGVRLSNAVYRSGESLSITLSPSQPMVVQIFQWLPYEPGDGQVLRVFPNRFDDATLIDKPTTIPDQKAGGRYQLTLLFPESQAKGRKVIEEYLLVVASRKPLALRASYSLADFNASIAEIPLQDRRLVRRAYSIARGSP